VLPQSRANQRMAPPACPSPVDRFFARYQNPILMVTFATQIGHYQYIRRTSPAFEAVSSTVKAPAIPRALRAGLGWAVVFIGLLTKSTLAKKTVGDYSDPVIALASQRKQWRRPAPEGL
jgi:hypothetical protein